MKPLSRINRVLELIYFTYLAALPCVGTFFLYQVLPATPHILLTWVIGVAAIAIYVAALLRYTPALTSSFQNTLRLVDGPFWFLIAVLQGGPWIHLLIEVAFLEMLIVLIGQCIAGLLIFQNLHKHATPQGPGPAPASLLVLIGPALALLALFIYYATQTPDITLAHTGFWIASFGQGLFSLLVQQRAMRTDTAQRAEDTGFILLPLTPVVWTLVLFIAAALRG